MKDALPLALWALFMCAGYGLLVWLVLYAAR